MKGKILQSRILYLTRISFRFENKIKNLNYKKASLVTHW